MLFNPHQMPNPHLAREIDRLSGLKGDMKRLQRGVPPEALANTHGPLLDQRELSTRPVPCLVGFSSGHPELLGSKRNIRTSDVWILTEDKGWARTLSRWYRLGRPADLADLNS